MQLYLTEKSHTCLVKDTLKAFNDFKNKATKVYKVMFFDM